MITALFNGEASEAGPRSKTTCKSYLFGVDAQIRVSLRDDPSRFEALHAHKQPRPNLTRVSPDAQSQLVATDVLLTKQMDE